VAVAITNVKSDPPRGPVLGTHLVEGYVTSLATLAYIWGWPLVNMHNRRLVFSKVPESGLGDGILPVAPLNQLTMLTDYIRPEERAVATPNQDTVYGFGIFSLDKEPAVFQIPDFGKRYWVYQLGDQRTDAIIGLGSVYSTKPGIYMVVGPDWNGTVPDGITAAFRSPTNLAYITPRAFMDDTKEDRAAVQPLVSQIVAYPLSAFDGKMKTKDWSKIPKLADPAGGKSGSGGETKWVKAEAFFDELAAVIKEVPPLAGEEAIYALFQSLLDAGARDKATKALMIKAAMAAENTIMKELHHYSHAGVPVEKWLDVADQWRAFRHRLLQPGSRRARQHLRQSQERSRVFWPRKRQCGCASQWREQLHRDIRQGTDAAR
jgi:hypothetical protein